MQKHLLNITHLPPKNNQKLYSKSKKKPRKPCIFKAFGDFSFYSHSNITFVSTVNSGLNGAFSCCLSTKIPPIPPIRQRMCCQKVLSRVYYKTLSEIILQIWDTFAWLINSNLTFPKPENHISSSLSKSKTPAVSTENACILL